MLCSRTTSTFTFYISKNTKKFNWQYTKFTTRLIALCPLWLLHHTMKILSTTQIRELDAYTIQHEPIDSIDLMERASVAFTEWFAANYDTSRPIHIVCGPGNNGGDGLAVARLLDELYYKVEVSLFLFSEKTSTDFDTNLKRLQEKTNVSIHHIHEDRSLPVFAENTVLIDAILGSGLARPVENFLAYFIQHINNQNITRVSIDIPSGLFADKYSDGMCIHAAQTCCFEVPKLAFMMPENHARIGAWTAVPIGLHSQKMAEAESHSHYISSDFIKNIIKKRNKYDHKGRFGHALLVVGSRGMLGAALLAARACMRSGVGLLTVHAPKALENTLLQTLPEAMYSREMSECFETIPSLKIYSERVRYKYNVIGIGCGLGKHKNTALALKGLMQKWKRPMVIDADALNLIAEQETLLRHVPKASILTPHPKEFERLFGTQSNDFERNMVQVEKSVEHGIYIILKGAHTCISTPEGDCFFNSTGNPGMATAGSGDVLTGIVTGLLARGYSSEEAAILGVYLHGLAGDLAAKEIGQESMIASDIIEYLGAAFRVINERY